MRTPEFNAWFGDWEDAGEPRDNLIFVKNLSPARVVTVSLEVGEDGRGIFHKTVHGTKKKLHPDLPRVQPLPVGGPSTIDTAETSPAFAGDLSGSGKNNSTLSAHPRLLLPVRD